MGLVTKGRAVGRVHGLTALVASGRVWSLEGHVLLLDEDQGARRTIPPVGRRAAAAGAAGSGDLPACANTAELVGCRHGGMERGEVAHHAFVFILLVGMDSLCMLSEVVKARKLLRAVAGEGALAGVFPGEKSAVGI